MAAERIEVHPQGAYVDIQVGRGLGAVEEDHRIGPFPDPPGDVGHGVDGAQGVGDVAQGDDPGPLGEEVVEVVEDPAALIVDLEIPDPGAGPVCQELPRDQVGVMLQDRQQDLVPLADVVHPPGCGDEVDPVGRSPGPHQLRGIPTPDPGGDLPPGRLEGVGRPSAQLVDAPMDIGVVPLVVGRHGVEHGPGLLGGRGIVQVDQGMTVDLLIESREITPEAHGVQTRFMGTPGRRAAHLVVTPS